jgi:hypothetical protein
VSFSTPQDIAAAYENGLPGWQFNQGTMDALMADQKAQCFADVAEHLRGTGKGKRAMLWRSRDLFDPGAFGQESQTTGDCLPRWALIRMANGSLKRIEDVQSGESVLTPQGNARSVSRVIRKDRPRTGTICRVTFANDHRNLLATPDHLILIQDEAGQQHWIEAGALQAGQAVVRPSHASPEVCAVQYDMADYCCHGPITENEPPETRRIAATAGFVRQCRQRHEVRRIVDLDERLAWLFGLYLAEGSMDYCDGKPLRITLNIGSHRVAHAEQAAEYFRQIFGVPAAVSQVPSKPTVIYVRAPSSIVASLFADQCPGNVYDKRLPSAIFTAPRETRLALLRGWCDGDGHMSRCGELIAVSVSRDLIGGMMDLAASCGIGVRSRCDHAREDRAIAYRMFCGAGHVWRTPEEPPAPNAGTVKTVRPSVRQSCKNAVVDAVVVEPFEDEVFCLSVVEDEAFIADGFAVHNCVSHGSRNARDITRSVEIHIKREPEEYYLRGATEATYGARGWSGQGMDPATATRFEVDHGFLFRQSYPFADLSKYDARIGTGWGSRGVPEAVKEECRKHNVGRYVAPKTSEEAQDLLHAGYGIHSGQSYGVGAQSDARGISRKAAAWNHDMATGGYDDTREVYPVCVFLILNSWGLWNKKPLVWPEEVYGPWPEGSFWITEEDYARWFVGTGSIFAYCDINGVPQKKLPDWGNLKHVLG